MPKFRKKPVVIEAVQWTGDNAAEVTAFRGGACLFDADGPIIDTLEGNMKAMPGDWIIKEPHPTGGRQFYPCKPDIFAATYEAAE